MVRFKSASDIWEAALGELQLQVNKTNYQTWLKDTRGISHADHRFIIGVPNIFTSAWLEKRLYSLIKRILVKVTSDPEVEISFVVHTGNGGDTINEVSNPPRNNPSGPDNQGCIRPDNTLFLPETDQVRLNPNFTFDKFITGDNNLLAYNCALSASEKSGDTYNPIFIHASNGLGKTHLLQAIAHRVKASNKRIVFVTAEKFTNEFIESLKEKKMAEFRLKYRYTDILLVDDMDFMSGKDHTQEGFYHTVKDLHAENRQIVITSHCPLESIPSLSSHLRSCLDGGLAVSIKRPDLNTRISILKAKAEQRRIKLLPEVIDFIASKDSENISRLEGYLNRIIAVQKIKGALSLALARETLEENEQEKTHSSFTPVELITRISLKLNISLEAVTNNRKRSLELNRVRQIIIYLLREKCHCTFNEIGSLLGGKDHSSILYGYEKASLLLDQETSFRNEVEGLSKELQLA